MSSFIEYFQQIFTYLLEGLGLTLYLGVSSFLLSLIIGGFFVVISSTENRWVKRILDVYVSFFRGTPLLMQLFLFYYGLPMVLEFMITMPKDMALILSLALNSAAYVYEILRGALNAVDSGQYEAAIAFGMGHFQALRRIIFPQAIISAFPPLMNNFMDMLKMTSIGMTIGIQELTSRSQLMTATTYRIFETYFIAILIYWGLSLIIGRIQTYAEYKLSYYQRR